MVDYLIIIGLAVGGYVVLSVLEAAYRAKSILWPSRGLKESFEDANRRDLF